MSIIDNLKGTQVTPKTAAIYITILLVIIGGIIFIVKSTMMPSQDVSATPETSLKSSPVKVTLKDNDKNTIVKASNTASTAKPVDPCVLIAQRNIFKAVTGSGSSMPGSNKPIPPITLGVMPSMPGGPFGMQGMRGPGGGADQGNVKIAFTGIVKTPDGIMALLENTSNNETKYVRVGDNAFGASVTEVTATAVSIIKDGQTVKLVLGENKISAPPPAASPSTPPGGPTPGAPGAPGQAMPPGGMPSGMPTTMMVAPTVAGGNGGSGRGRRRNGN